ncbi:MAG: lipopolysaccharide biosynthesis protein [Desulfococcaceae bacterium]
MIYNEKLKIFFQNKNTRSLFSGAGSVFLIKSVGIGIMFGTQVFLARILGAEEYGYFVYAMTWMTILAIFARQGLDTSLVRLIPEYMINNKWGLLKGLLRYARIRVCIAGIGISVITALIVWFGFKESHFKLSQSFWLMLMALPVYSWVGIQQAILRAYRHVGLAEMPDAIVRSIGLCIGCGIIFFVFDEILSWQAWLFNLIAIVLSFGLMALWCNNKKNEKINTVQSVTNKPEWKSISFSMLLMGGMNVIINNSPIIILGFYASSEDIAVYGAVSRIMALVSFGLIAVNAIAAPMIAELYHSGQKQELQRILNIAAWGIFICTIVAVFILTVFGKYILNLFGSDFVCGYIPLVIMCGGQIINALCGSVGLLMNMTDHHSYAVKIVFFSMLINVILGKILIENYLVIGAAWISSITICLWNIIMLFFSIKYIELNPTIFHGLYQLLYQIRKEKML